MKKIHKMLTPASKATRKERRAIDAYNLACHRLAQAQDLLVVASLRAEEAGTKPKAIDRAWIKADAALEALLRQSF